MVEVGPQFLEMVSRFPVPANVMCTLRDHPTAALKLRESAFCIDYEYASLNLQKEMLSQNE